ncbi:nuclear transport factor 2 family protein [Glycomyces sp. NPDC046736]|uniref:nuclear transport factor 2 family protein n=1 Tax=Glycomyces sp. NPDC046736 TaxID=3155615 RepID=UPI0033FDFA1B
MSDGALTPEEEVRAFAAVRDAALVSNDAALIADHMTEDWGYVDANGFTPKADVIAWIASGRLAHHSMTTTEGERIARIGDTVVTLARVASSGTWESEPYTTDEWISEIYVRTEGRWQVAFTQKTDA